MDVVNCTGCGRANRVRPSAAGRPECGVCGRPLPWLVEADLGSFPEVVERSSLPVLVDFWAPWCGPCRAVAPLVERASQELAGSLKVVKVNVDRAPELAERFGVRGIPTLVLLVAGRERDRITGAPSGGALRDWLGARLTVTGSG